MAYQDSTADYGVTTAVIDCIAREGIHQVSVDVIARELNRSRSVLFQRFILKKRFDGWPRRRSTSFGGRP